MVFRFIKQMSNAKKEKIRMRLSILYAAIAWNGFAVALYYITKREKTQTNLPLGLYEAAISESVENAKVYRFDGLTLVEKTEYGKEEIEEAREKIKNPPKSEDSNGDF